MILSKWIPGFEGRYKVNTQGNVISVSRWKRRKDIILKYGFNKKGYPQVRLSKNNIKTSFRVNRLVAKAFIDNPDKKDYVNHIDGNKLNNDIANLEWVTAHENMQHAIHTGLHNTSGENGCNKITEKEVIIIKKLKGKLTNKILGSFFGVSASNISLIQTNKRWRHLEV